MALDKKKVAIFVSLIVIIAVLAIAVLFLAIGKKAPEEPFTLEGCIQKYRDLGLTEENYRPETVFVGFQPDTSDEKITEILNESNLTLIQYDNNSKNSLIGVPKGKEFETVCNFRAREDVKYADIIRRVQA